MTTFDIIVLVLIGASCVIGAMRGLIEELLSIAAWVFALIAVRFLEEPVAAALVDWVKTDVGAHILGFALIFGIVFLLGKWAARKIGEQSRDSLIGPLDRVLGAGFGALKGLLVATVIFLSLNFLLDFYAGGASKRPAWLADSRTYPLLRASGAAVSAVIAERTGKKANKGDEDEASEMAAEPLMLTNEPSPRQK